MLNQEEKEKIERYIIGLADDKEKIWVESLFLNGEDNYYLQKQIKDDWDNLLKIPFSKEVDLNHILDRVHHTIRKNDTLKRQKPIQRIIRIYIKAAAFLLIPLLISGGLAYSYIRGQQNSSAHDQLVNSTIYAPFGARVSFNLPDGTSGMLNSGSRLVYSLPFSNNRQVKLEGEAWLDIKHDADHPFKINTGNSTVKVLGTSFNISAYPAENYVEVVVNEGKVEFFDTGSKEKITILPSERLVSRNKIIRKSVTDPTKYNSWTQGKLVFRGDPMAEVARRIERWYNVKVELADKDLERYTFRATFNDDTLEEVLRLLSMTSPIRYQITPRKLISDETYQKELITIYLKR